jgi:hypothetical protein
MDCDGSNTTGRNLFCLCPEPGVGPIHRYARPLEQRAKTVDVHRQPQMARHPGVHPPILRADRPLFGPGHGIALPDYSTPNLSIVYLGIC